MPEKTDPPVAIEAEHAPQRSKPSNYPEPFASMMTGRIKRPLGDLFGLESFGVNHVTLPAGAVSALYHRHSTQDECVFVLSGEVTLVHDHGETTLSAGMFAGFRHGTTSHQLVNRSSAEATYLEVGDRQKGDHVEYERDDLVAVQTDGAWRFTHKDGSPY